MSAGPAILEKEIKTILALKATDEGLTDTAIAEIVGRSRMTVARATAKYKALLDQYRELKSGDIIHELDLVRRAHLANVANPEKIEACSALQSATVFGILTDKLLLESGRPTSITLNANVDTTMPDLRSRLKRTLEQRAGHTSSSDDNPA